MIPVVPWEYQSFHAIPVVEGNQEDGAEDKNSRELESYQSFHQYQSYPTTTVLVMVRKSL